MSNLTQIKPIEASEQELQELRNDYEKLVVTPQTLGDADKARLKLKNKRLEIQRQQKANNQVLKEIKKDNDDRADRLVGIIEPVEIRLSNEIEAIKAEEKRKEEEQRMKELQRIQSHRNRITAIAQNTARLAINQSIDDIKAKIKETIDMGESFDEFTEETLEVRDLFILSAQNRVKQLETEWEEKMKKSEAILEQAKLDLETKEEPRKADLVWSGDDKVELKANPEGRFNVAVIEERIEEINPKPYKIQEEPLQVPVNYSIMGFDFHIALNIPETETALIKSSIEKILGEMEI